MDNIVGLPSSLQEFFSTLMSSSGPVVGKFPEMSLYDKTGALVLSAPLIDVANGNYCGTFVMPATLGAYVGHIEYYDDAALTTPTPGVPIETFCVRSRDTVGEFLDRAYCTNVADGSLGQVFAAIAANAGLNSIVDCEAAPAGHNANNNLLVHRIRLFATAAAAAAATPHNPDNTDGECWRGKSQASYDPGQSTVNAEVMRHFTRISDT